MPEPDLLTSGRERTPADRPPPGRRVGLLVLAVALGAAAVVATHGSHHEPPAAGVRPLPPLPSPTSVTALADVTSTPEPLPPLAIPDDLGTVVSVGHVRSTAVDGDAHAPLVEQVLHTVPLGAGFVLAPQPGSTTAAPKGLEVLFDRRLSDPQERAFVTAVEHLPGTTASVTEEPGTSVDVSAPVLAAGGCAPVAAAPPGQADPAFARWFPLFALTTAGDHVVLSYTGPVRTPDQLGQTASFLARLCGVGVDDVRFSRHEAH